MDSKLRSRGAFLVYLLFIALIAFGFVVSPLLMPPRSQEPVNLGTAIPRETIGQYTLPILVTVSAASSSEFNQTLQTMTPVLTTILVGFGVGSKNLTSLFQITQVTIVVNNAFLSSDLTRASPVDMSLNVSTNSQNDWTAEGSENLEYTQAGNWTGTLLSTAVLNNGTIVKLDSPLNPAGPTIYASSTYLTTLSEWIFSVVIWACAVISLLAGLYFVRNRPSQPMRHRKREH